jgi:AraC-like DNA-binding protein
MLVDWLHKTYEDIVTLNDLSFQVEMSEATVEALNMKGHNECPCQNQTNSQQTMKKRRLPPAKLQLRDNGFKENDVEDVEQ